VEVVIRRDAVVLQVDAEQLVREDAIREHGDTLAGRGLGRDAAAAVVRDQVAIARARPSDRETGAAEVRRHEYAVAGVAQRTGAARVHADPVAGEPVREAGQDGAGALVAGDDVALTRRGAADDAVVAVHTHARSDRRRRRVRQRGAAGDVGAD